MEAIVDQILSRAADLIEKHGWHQGEMCGPNGEMCTLEAILQASFESARTDGSRFSAAVTEFKRRAGISRLGISTWNDSSERSRDQVVAALRNAKL